MASNGLARACFEVLYLIALGLAPAHAEYRKEPPVALILTANGGQFTPAGTKTPLTARPGIFLFAGDALSGENGSVQVLWCPDGAAKKFEYTIIGSATLTMGQTPLSLPDAKELDLCMFPALERTPEVATLPALPDIVPPPLPASQVQQDIADTPPETAAALHALGRRELNDPRIRLAYAVGLANAGLIDEAIDQYGELARLWPHQPRLARLILDLKHTGSTREIVHPAAPNPAGQTGAASTQVKGKTYALVIGIKKYEGDNIPDLLFPDADARDFARFLTSDRGGKAEVVTLINEQARAAEIRNRMADMLAKLRKDDTFVLFVAAHGDMQGDMPIVVTYRANNQYTALDSLPLSEIQKLRYGEKTPFRQVRVFLDICHAGRIALLDPAAPGSRASPAPPKQFICLTATHQGRDAFAYEDKKFGHGVFSYFLLRGLNTREAIARPDDRFLTAEALSRFVETWVANATTAKDGKPRQKPTSLLDVTLDQEIADLTLPGIDFADTRPLASLVIPSEALGKFRRQTQVAKTATVNVEGEAARTTTSSLTRRISLEDEGELILLRYLQGDEVPQERDDFRRGAALFAEALSLQPGSPYLEARLDFCEGRALVFDKNYRSAIERLERSILLDPGAAYAYNALGIAYLEGGEYQTARLAFEDAIQRAPKWAYPRHNLALTRTQAGDYEGAIRSYQEAKERAPDYFYLPYNLGLLLQRMNRMDEAETEYRLAARNAARKPPGRAEPYIALGSVKASERKWSEAERYYRMALSIPAVELSQQTARHNLALLLARNDKGWSEAERLWGENGNYVPSQLAYADALAAKGRRDDAIRQYREVLREMPDHLAARLQLATQMEHSGDRKAAIAELRHATTQDPKNALVLERLAGNLAASNSVTEAAQLYRSALGYSADPDQRRRINKALKRLEKNQ